jgi:DNA segregation ATPase FtsK/SpoIIIE, S-DNA-T family
LAIANSSYPSVFIWFFDMASRASHASSQSGYLNDAHMLLGSFMEFSKTQVKRGVGLACLLLAGFLGLACLTYHSTDPSLNTAADDVAHVGIGNWGGALGAIMADVMLQTIGAGVIVVIAALFYMGRALVRQEELPRRLWFRALLLGIAIFSMSVAGARIPSLGLTLQPYLGGAVGMMGLNSLAAYLQPVLGPWVHLGVAMTGVLAAFLFTCFAMGVTLPGAVARLIALGLVMMDAGRALISFGFDRYQLWRDPTYDPDVIARRRTPRRRAAPPVRSTDDDDEIDDDLEEENYPRRAMSDIKVVRPVAAKTKPKKVAKQLDLEDAGDFALPALDLLQEAPAIVDAERVDEAALRKNADLLQNVLSDYHVRGDIVSIHPGPVVTLYELEPAPGTKSSRVIGLANDIARSMAAVSVRAAVVPGRNVIGVEIPNKKRQTVYLREMLTSEAYVTSPAKLAMVLGKDIGGHPVIADLARMPHLLVAGTTGSGKSVAINTMILSLLYRLTPKQCRFIMIDPKMLELSVYDDIPHLLTPVVTEPGKAIVALKWAVAEMENRYRAMSKLGVRNIEGYNARLAEARKTGEVLLRKIQTGFDPESGHPVYEEQPLDLTELPYIVVVVDEFADLMLVAGKDVEAAIQRLAQMARAAGIHLIMATQRPSVDVITGVVKANFPTRISFQVTSKIDSRTILQEGGAEQLLGMGDMLHMAPGGRITRVHGPFVADAEVEQVVAHLKAQGSPEYLDEVTAGDGNFGSDMFGGPEGASGNGVDDLYDQAVALIAREGKASTSFIQRHLQIGYNRAARIIEEMEKEGVVGPANHVGKREVLVGDHSGRH